jgi:hypothetical protein
MSGLELMEGSHGELAGEGKEGEGGEEAGGVAWARHGEREGCRRGAPWGLGLLLRPPALCTWEQKPEKENWTWGRREEGKIEEKEKEGKEKKRNKKEKIWKFSKLENFWKIKDNLRSWSKIIFVKERNKPKYN